MTVSNDSSPGPTEPSAAHRRSHSADADAAYRAWVELTVAEPLNQEAWIRRAEAARDMQEKITSLTRALELNPANGLARRALHACLQELLVRDASLEYLGETNTSYRVRTPTGFEFIHPKDRVSSGPEPPPGRTPRDSVYRWLKWSLLGLIPVGLGTLLLAPVTTIQAITELQHPLDQSNRRRMWIAILLSMLLWLVALALGAILALHLT